jgi:hypothetical protein
MISEKLANEVRLTNFTWSQKKRWRSASSRNHAHLVDLASPIIHLQRMYERPLGLTHIHMMQSRSRASCKGDESESSDHLGQNW